MRKLVCTQCRVPAKTVNKVSRLVVMCSDCGSQEDQTTAYAKADELAAEQRAEESRPYVRRRRGGRRSKRLLFVYQDC